jgi:glycerophosphoryl diester phosphodiesterase
MTHAKRRGWKVNVWTVNEPAEVKRLLGLGVDGIIGDVPNVLLEQR